jgi:hypothetical protein
MLKNCRKRMIQENLQQDDDAKELQQEDDIRDLAARRWY